MLRLERHRDTRELAAALMVLGDFQFRLARYPAAESTFRRAAGVSAPGALLRLGDCQRVLGRFRAAEVTLLAAGDGAAASNALGVVYKEYHEIGAILHNLAAVHAAQGRSGDARRCRAAAVAIFERALGPDHPRTRALDGSSS